MKWITRQKVKVDRIACAWLTRGVDAPCHRLNIRGGHGTEITRAFDNRPMSSRSQVLFRSNTEVKPCLAAALPAIQPIPSTQSPPFRAPPFRALDGPGESRSRGWIEQHRGGNDVASTGSSSNLMTECSPTLACRGQSPKKCAGLPCTSLRGATANDLPMLAIGWWAQLIPPAPQLGFDRAKSFEPHIRSTTRVAQARSSRT